jgi:ribonucleoside-diphosphate reductase beta chain
LEQLKIDPKEVNDHPELADRISYLKKHMEKDPKIIGKKRILKKLVLFTALVERASLFTQFYILMSYARSNRGLKTISSLQRSTATEEIIHYSLGIDVVNIIKEENPQLWSEYLVDLVEKNIKVAYTSELKLIDWFFENGVPEHITREEVINFLNYNFNVIAKDLDLDLNYEYDEVLYEEKNQWMMEKILAPVEVDFFDNNAGGYSSDDTEVDIDNFEF